MLRVCVIGLGNIGNLHASIYAEDELVELVGVCDILEDRAIAASKRLGVPYYLDAPTMLRELKPDLVSVATGGYEYSSDHFLPTIQALEAGCHVTGGDRSSRENLEEEVLDLERQGCVLRVGEGYLDGLEADLVFRTPGMHPQ